MLPKLVVQAAMLAMLASPPSVHAQAAAQRTMGAAPPPVTPSNGPPDMVDSMVRAYRTMWQKMTAPQQKAFLDSGGSTPEQYERTLRSKGVPGVPAAAASGTGSATSRPAQSDPRSTMNALDSLTTSLQDLNAIRDSNLTRVQKDGCPPEVTSRLADLRARLRRDEAELTGTDSRDAAAPQPKAKAGGDPMAIANDWFKQAPAADKTVERKTQAPAETRESKLLGDALADTGPAAVAAARPAESKPRKELEEEMARTKAEIGQLSGACATLAK